MRPTLSMLAFLALAVPALAQGDRPKGPPPNQQPPGQLGQQPRPTDQKPAAPRLEVGKPGQPTPGKVIERPRTDLRQWDKPVPKPPTPRPTPPPHHSAHWHPRVGWVFLPVATAPRVLILEESYVLPPRVQVYETAQPVTTEVICPHCGQRITIYVR